MATKKTEALNPSTVISNMISGMEAMLNDLRQLQEGLSAQGAKAPAAAPVPAKRRSVILQSKFFGVHAVDVTNFETDTVLTAISSSAADGSMLAGAADFLVSLISALASDKTGLPNPDDKFPTKEYVVKFASQDWPVQVTLRTV